MLCQQSAVKVECLIFTIFSLIFHPIGLLINAFIVGVNLIGMRQNKSVKPVDKVLLCLGFSRFCLQSVLIFETMTYLTIFIEIPYNMDYVIVFSIQKSLDYCNLWFTAWLCLIYCLKIANCKLQIFVLLKLRIPQIIFPAILVSTFISGIFGCLFAQSYARNSTLFARTKRAVLSWELVMPAAVFGHVLPFLIVTLCSLCIVQTLLSHIHKLKKIRCNVTGPRMAVHVSTIRSVLLYFTVSVSKFISSFLLWTVPVQSYWYIVVTLIYVLYPTFHSTLILLGNSKLKNAFYKMFSGVKKCRIVKKSSDCNVVGGIP